MNADVTQEMRTMTAVTSHPTVDMPLRTTRHVSPRIVPLSMVIFLMAWLIHIPQAEAAMQLAYSGTTNGKLVGGKVNCTVATSQDIGAVDARFNTNSRLTFLSKFYKLQLQIGSRLYNREYVSQGITWKHEDNKWILSLINVAMLEVGANQNRIIVNGALTCGHFSEDE